jgi:hypothetical protein
MQRYRPKTKHSKWEDYTHDPQNVFKFYKEDGSVHWEAPLYRAKCKGKLEDGSECEKYTSRVHPYCYSCMVRVFRVSIAPSTQGPDAGLGLFCTDLTKDDGEVVFERGDFICCYMGEYLNEKDILERYTGTAGGKDSAICCPYAIEVSGGRTVDGAILRGPAAFANDSKSKAYNAVLCEEPVLGLVASRTIRNNEEVLCDYGKQYWRSKHMRYEIAREEGDRDCNSSSKKRKTKK